LEAKKGKEIHPNMRPKRVVIQLIATGIFWLVIVSECLNKNDTKEDVGHLRVVVAPVSLV